MRRITGSPLPWTDDPSSRRIDSRTPPEPLLRGGQICPGRAPGVPRNIGPHAYQAEVHPKSCSAPTMVSTKVGTEPTGFCYGPFRRLKLPQAAPSAGLGAPRYRVGMKFIFPVHRSPRTTPPPCFRSCRQTANPLSKVAFHSHVENVTNLKVRGQLLDVPKQVPVDVLKCIEELMVGRIDIRGGYDGFLDDLGPPSSASATSRGVRLTIRPRFRSSFLHTGDHPRHAANARWTTSW